MSRYALWIMIITVFVLIDSGVLVGKCRLNLYIECLDQDKSVYPFPLTQKLNNAVQIAYMILIAPWGNPSGWKEVDYCFNGETTRSATSLKPLKGAFNPKNVLIIALDSSPREAIATEISEKVPRERSGATQTILV